MDLGISLNLLTVECPHPHLCGGSSTSKCRPSHVIVVSDPTNHLLRADVNGSTELATDCYLPINRSYPSIYGIFDKDTRAETHDIVHRRISVFCSSEALMETLTNFALFLKALDLARSRSDVRFDPDAMMEDYYILASQLLNVPDCNLLDNSPPTPDPISDHLASSLGVGYACLKALESSVRLADLLYAKRWNPDPIDKRSEHPVLLGLMEKNLRIVLASICNKAEDSNIDPSLLLDSDTSGVAPSRKTLGNRLRPALIHAILIGKLVSDLGQGKADKIRYDITVYQELLVELVGRTAADVDAVPESDLDFIQLHTSSRFTGKKFHVRDTMKRIILECLDRTL